MKDVKYMDIKEFRESGFLQEVNRRFLHPCGLALEVVIDDDGTERLGGIWDYRDDPEGILYNDDELSLTKAEAVEQEIRKHEVQRIAIQGMVVQPVW
jgi:hypothetical protein